MSALLATVQQDAAHSQSSAASPAESAFDPRILEADSAPAAAAEVSAEAPATDVPVSAPAKPRVMFKVARR